MAHNKVQSAALKDVALISLVKANTSMATEDDRTLFQHVIACQAPRPCPTHVNCDMGKEQLVHFRQCRDRTCDLCALARLIVARDKNRPIVEWQVKLLGARRSLIKATTKVKDTVNMVSQARSSQGGNVAEAKAALLEAKNLQREAKKNLDYVCGRIYDEWLNFAEDRGSQNLQVAGDANEKSIVPLVQGAKVEITQTPPQEPPAVILPSPKGEPSRVPQTPPLRDSSMRTARVPRSPSTQDADVLASLVRANTSFVTAEDKALFDHVSTCEAPRPCPANGLCDVGKERLVHFGSCRTKTCDICAFGRLIEAKDKQRPVGDLQGPLLKARAQMKRTFGEAKVAMNAYLSKKLEVGGQAEAARLKPEMDAAKRAHAAAKNEYERLCTLVFSEWMQIRKDPSENEAETRAQSPQQLQPPRAMVSKQTDDTKLDNVVKFEENVGNVQQMQKMVKASGEQRRRSESVGTTNEKPSRVEGKTAKEANETASSADPSMTMFTFEKYITLDSEKDMEAMIVSLVKSQSTAKASTNPRDLALFTHASTCTNPRPCHENGSCDAAKQAWNHYVNCDSAPCLCCTMARLVALQEKRDVGLLQSMLLKARSGFISAKKLLEKAEEQDDEGSKEGLHNDFQRAKGAFDFLSKEILDKWGTVARPSPFATPRIKIAQDDSAMEVELQPNGVDDSSAKMELYQQVSDTFESANAKDEHEQQPQQQIHGREEADRNMTMMEGTNGTISHMDSRKEGGDLTELAITHSTLESEMRRDEFTRLPPPHAFTSSIIPSPVISARSLSSNLIRDISEGSLSDVLMSAPSPKLISPMRALSDSSNVSDKTESAGDIAVRMTSSSSSGDEKGLVPDRQATSSSLDFDAIQLNESDMRQMSDTSTIIPSPMKPLSISRPASAAREHSDSTIIPSPMVSTTRRELFKETRENDSVPFSLTDGDNNGVAVATEAVTKNEEEGGQVGEEKQHEICVETNNTQLIVPSPMLTISRDYGTLRHLKGGRSGSSSIVNSGEVGRSVGVDEQSIIVPSPMLTKTNVEILLAGRLRSDSSAVFVSDIAMPTPLPSILTDSKLYIRERSESLRVPVPSYAAGTRDKDKIESLSTKMVPDKDDDDDENIHKDDEHELKRNSGFSVNEEKPMSSINMLSNRSNAEDYLGSISKSLLLSGQSSSALGNKRLGNSSSKFSVLMRVMRSSSDDLDAGFSKEVQQLQQVQEPSTQTKVVTEALEFSPRMNAADNLVLSKVLETSAKQESKDGDNQEVNESQKQRTDEMQFVLDSKSHKDDSKMDKPAQQSPGSQNIVSHAGTHESDQHHQWSTSVDFDVDDSHDHEQTEEPEAHHERIQEATSDNNNNPFPSDDVSKQVNSTAKKEENACSNAIISGGFLNSRNDVLASLVRASTRYGTAEDCAFFQHVSSCTAPRPCLQHPQCDAGKLQLVHFQKCQDKTCDSCAVARLLEARDRNHNVAELESALLEARERLAVAAKDLKTAIGLKANIPKCKETHKLAKKELESVCERIFMLWSNKNPRPADEPTVRTFTPQSTHQSQRNRSSSHAAIVADSPPDAPSYHTRSAAKRLRQASVDSVSPSSVRGSASSTSNNNNTSPVKRSSASSSGSPHATRRTRSMSSGRDQSAAATSTKTSAKVVITSTTSSSKDVLKRIVLAEVEDALGENVAFRDHVLACRAPKPCAYEDCTLAKDRMAHFQSCQKDTCESCSLARLIQAKRGGSSIKVSESHFTRVRDEHLVANERTTKAIKSFMESKGDPKLGVERKRALDEAKEARNKLRVELDNLCQGIFKEWSKHWLNKHRH